MPQERDRQEKYVNLSKSKKNSLPKVRNEKKSRQHDNLWTLHSSKNKKFSQ